MRRSPEDWLIVDHPANSCPRPDGPDPTTPVRGVAQAAQQRTGFQDASTSEVPTCVVPRMATTVVLARCSAPERVRPAAPTAPVGFSLRNVTADGPPLRFMQADRRQLSPTGDSYPGPEPQRASPGRPQGARRGSLDGPGHLLQGECGRSRHQLTPKCVFRRGPRLEISIKQQSRSADATVMIGAATTAPIAGLVTVAIFALVALTIYLLPTGIAWARQVPNVGKISVLNILLGWSLLGWLVALAWACKSVESTTIDAVQAPLPHSALPYPQHD
jgi:hypothetical protein